MHVSVNFDQLERAGYSFTEGVVAGDLINIAQLLGPIRVDRRSPEPVRDIRPQPAHSAKQNTLSSRYGIDAFPFHTDAAHWDQPARYLAMYCVDPGEGRRPTLLQDSRAWQLDDVEMELACRALWATGHVRPRICMLAERIADRLAIRYDKDCMRPMTAEARELAALIESRIDKTEQEQIDWEPCSLLVIDNQRLVHARGRSGPIDTKRTLKRILIGGA